VEIVVSGRPRALGEGKINFCTVLGQEERLILLLFG